MDSRDLISKAIKYYRYQDRGYWYYGYKIDNKWILHIAEHRLTYEYYHDCCLLPWAEIHHINGDRNDNRIANLAGLTICQHTAVERKGRKMSEKARLMIAAYQKGRPKSIETRKKMGLSMIGNSKGVRRSLLNSR